MSAFLTSPALPIPAPTRTPDPRLYNWHRTAPVPAPLPRPRDTGAYIPELSERLERDPNLTDGARRCARLIAAYAYRRNREVRAAGITVSYLQTALGKCRRTVQNYLRQLERNGYVKTAVAVSTRSRLCVGLVIELLTPLFARHHRQKWPDKAMKSAVQRFAQNYRAERLLAKIPVADWDLRCRIGMADAICPQLPPLPDYFAV